MRLTPVQSVYRHSEILPCEVRLRRKKKREKKTKRGEEEGLQDDCRRCRDYYSVGALAGELQRSRDSDARGREEKMKKTGPGWRSAQAQ